MIFAYARVEAACPVGGTTSAVSRWRTPLQREALLQPSAVVEEPLFQPAPFLAHLVAACGRAGAFHHPFRAGKAIALQFQAPGPLRPIGLHRESAAVKVDRPLLAGVTGLEAAWLRHRRVAVAFVFRANRGPIRGRETLGGLGTEQGHTGQAHDQNRRSHLTPPTLFARQAAE